MMSQNNLDPFSVLLSTSQKSARLPCFEIVQHLKEKSRAVTFQCIVAQKKNWGIYLFNYYFSYSRFVQSSTGAKTIGHKCKVNKNFFFSHRLMLGPQMERIKFMRPLLFFICLFKETLK